MLSRTAEGLFWMARYVERMDNVSRLLDAGRRMDNLPHQGSTHQSEWISIVIASGASSTFPLPLEDSDRASVARHLIRDMENPSSIASCIEAARMNAKAIRNAITAELWEAINDTRIGLREQLMQENDKFSLSAFLDWVRERAGLTMGRIDSTLLRDDGYRFIELGKWFERADATARMLDVKYHVLLPKVTDVGGGIDYLQWVQILRAANSAMAFRHLYRRSVDPKGVVDLLVLNEKSPRSLITALTEIRIAFDKLADDVPLQRQMTERVARAEQKLRATSTDEIFETGLHDWLTAFITETNETALAVSDAFGFGPEQVSVTAEASQ